MEQKKKSEFKKNLGFLDKTDTRKKILILK